MTERVLRWNVSVNDRVQEIGGGDVLMVACRDRLDVVEVWTLETVPEEWPALPPVKPQRRVLVVGTGYALPKTAVRHLGSTVTSPQAALVWHVFEMGDDR